MYSSRGFCSFPSLTTFKSRISCTFSGTFNDCCLVKMIFFRFGRGLPIDSYVFLPIITVWPDVTFLKCAKSFGKCHGIRSEEHTSELQSRGHLVCRLLLEKKKN